jgi:VWFA-related protein
MADRLAGLARLGRSFGWTLLPLALTLASLAPAAGGAPQPPTAPEPALQAPPPEHDGAAVDPAVAQLAPRFRDWLETAAPFITEAERAAFLALSRDYQRDAFIDRFWRERDPYPQTPRNELRERFDERVNSVRATWGDFDDDRSRILLIHGPPAHTIQIKCTATLIPAEIWSYAGSDQVDFPFLLVFVKSRWDGPARVFDPRAGLLSPGLLDRAKECVNGQLLRGALAYIDQEGDRYDAVLARVLSKPRPRNEEWLASFTAFSTDLLADAAPLPAELSLAFPGRHDSRTVVQGMLTVPSSAVTVSEYAGYRSADFQLVGEVLSDGHLFESFRYKFGFPAPDLPAGGVPLAFQRYLRPGDYTLIVRLEDLASHRMFRGEREVTVPRVDELLPARPPTDSDTARIFAEATAAIGNGETTVKIVPPTGGILSGRVRFDTLAVGANIERVAFYLDGRYAMTKTRPPYDVELDLGEFPRLHTLRVEALDAAGAEVARDEKLLNAGGNRFAVRLTEPRRGKRYEESLEAHAEVEVPEGQEVQRVEFFLDDRRVATLYQPPFAQAIALPAGDEVTYVRATAYLADGSSAEDLVYVNAPPNLEQLDVQFVELYTTVTDARGRPVEGLTRADFKVAEDGVAQTIHRFDLVRNLPIHVGILLDNSASMHGSLEAVRRAALSFLQLAVTPRDQAAVITFNKFPHLAVKLTNNLQSLGGGLAGLTAEGETALYDSVIFSLYYLAGIRGQRALLVLSDGEDEASRFGFDGTLEYARRAGVTIYTIGLNLASGDAKRKLARLADETGGKSFLLGDAAGLDEIYRSIQQELRSQYLIAYQSTNTSGGDDFRNVQLTVDRPGVKVKTISGYYP